MSNDNVLEGMRCPNCGNEGVFRITATSVFWVDDEGTDYSEDVIWEDSSPCSCPEQECEFSGRVGDFREETIHFRNIRLFVNAGMRMPECYSHEELLDLSKGMLPTTGERSKVTCKACLEQMKKGGA